MTPPWAPCGAQFFPLHVQASLAYPRLDLPFPRGQARHPSRKPSSHGLNSGPLPQGSVPGPKLGQWFSLQWPSLGPLPPNSSLHGPSLHSDNRFPVNSA